jgi:hypothetical protein
MRSSPIFALDYFASASYNCTAFSTTKPRSCGVTNRRRISSSAAAFTRCKYFGRPAYAPRSKGVDRAPRRAPLWSSRRGTSIRKTPRSRQGRRAREPAASTPSNLPPEPRPPAAARPPDRFHPLPPTAPIRGTRPSPSAALVRLRRNSNSGPKSSCRATRGCCGGVTPLVAGNCRPARFVNSPLRRRQAEPYPDPARCGWRPAWDSSRSGRAPQFVRKRHSERACAAQFPRTAAASVSRQRHRRIIRSSLPLPWRAEARPTQGASGQPSDQHHSFGQQTLPFPRMGQPPAGSLKYFSYHRMELSIQSTTCLGSRTPWPSRG